MRGAASAAAAAGGGVGLADEYAAEMAELGGPAIGTGAYVTGGGRWGSSYAGQTWGRTPQHGNTASSAAIYHHPHAEAEDILLRGSQRGAGGGGAAGAGGGIYYSPPGTSYTIVERPSSAAHHHSSSSTSAIHYPAPPRSAEYVRDGYGSQLKLSSSTTTPRGTYLGGSNAVYTGGGGIGTANNNKKRPISPEQVLRMFGSSHHNSTTKLAPSDRVPTTSRRSPASSPASTTHQVSYRSPGGGYPVHELTTRTVTMVRDPPDGTHGFGICVKGGKDAGVGVYISRVEEGSVAERAGLRPGDTILEVNGTPFTGITHEEALKMLKSCRKLSMTVRSPALPGSGVGTLYSGAGGQWLVRQTCSWMDRQGRPVSPPLEYARTSCIVTAPPPPAPVVAPRYQGHSRSASKDRSIRRVDLCIEPGQSLGLMIRGGIEYNLGIFITGVDKDSVADRAGLMVGDQILEVNGQSFLDVTHDEAVGQLKYHKRMSLLVRDVGKVPHSCTAYDHPTAVTAGPGPPGSPGSRLSAANSARKWSAALQMVEEKARCLLARSEFASLCYYTDEYAAKHMDVEAYVHVVLELLNTPEKYTLLTELREIIAMEDRNRFDELVYNRPDPLRTGATTTGSRGDPRDHDYRHSRRKGGGLQLDTTNHHSMLMSSLHEISAPDYMGDGSTEMAVAVTASDEQYRSPSEDSGLGLAVADRAAANSHRARPPSAASNRGDSGGSGQKGASSDLTLSNDEDHTPGQGYCSGSDGEECCEDGRLRGRRHSSPGESQAGSATELREDEYVDSTGYLGGLRSQLGGWTQRMKSWYWGRPLELAHKLSRSFDMKDEQGLLDGGAGDGSHPGGMRRHQSMQRLARSDLGGPGSGDRDRPTETGPNVVMDLQGNLRVTVRKSKPILGIAIEGGANTKHPLPRIINIHENGAAYSAGGLEVGQLILQVDGQRVEGLQHQEVARLIAESFARPDREDIEFLVVEAKKSNLEPKPTALIFLEA